MVAVNTFVCFLPTICLRTGISLTIMCNLSLSTAEYERQIVHACAFGTKKSAELSSRAASRASAQVDQAHKKKRVRKTYALLCVVLPRTVIAKDHAEAGPKRLDIRTLVAPLNTAVVVVRDTCHTLFPINS